MSFCKEWYEWAFQDAQWGISIYGDSTEMKGVLKYRNLIIQRLFAAFFPYPRWFLRYIRNEMRRLRQQWRQPQGGLKFWRDIDALPCLLFFILVRRLPKCERQGQFFRAVIKRYETPLWFNFKFSIRNKLSGKYSKLHILQYVIPRSQLTMSTFLSIQNIVSTCVRLRWLTSPVPPLIISPGSLQNVIGLTTDFRNPQTSINSSVQVSIFYI